MKESNGLNDQVIVAIGSTDLVRIAPCEERQW